MSCNRAHARQRKSRRGVLTFEWILLVALLVVGLIGGLAGLRNALLDQLQDLENAVEAMNFSGTNTTTTASATAIAQRAHAKNSSVVAPTADNGYYAKRNSAANTNASQNQPDSAALSSDSASSRDTTGGRDSTSGRDIPSDANTWWGSGYR